MARQGLSIIQAAAVFACVSLLAGRGALCAPQPAQPHRATRGVVSLEDVTGQVDQAAPPPPPPPSVARGGVVALEDVTGHVDHTAPNPHRPGLGHGPGGVVALEDVTGHVDHTGQLPTPPHHPHSGGLVALQDVTGYPGVFGYPCQQRVNAVSGHGYDRRPAWTNQYQVRGLLPPQQWQWQWQTPAAQDYAHTQAQGAGVVSLEDVEVEGPGASTYGQVPHRRVARSPSPGVVALEDVVGPQEAYNPSFGPPAYVNTRPRPPYYNSYNNYYPYNYNYNYHYPIRRCPDEGLVVPGVPVGSIAVVPIAPVSAGAGSTYQLVDRPHRPGSAGNHLLVNDSEALIMDPIQDHAHAHAHTPAATPTGPCDIPPEFIRR